MKMASKHLDELKSIIKTGRDSLEDASAMTPTLQETITNEEKVFASSTIVDESNPPSIHEDESEAGDSPLPIPSDEEGSENDTFEDANTIPDTVIKGKTSGLKKDKQARKDEDFAFATQMTLDNMKEEIKKSKINMDTRVGYTKPPYYEVPASLEGMNRPGTTLDPEVKRAVCELWWTDQWDHLQNPPSWLDMSYFLSIVPVNTPNTEVRLAFGNMKSNLSMARARQMSDAQQAVVMIETGLGDPIGSATALHRHVQELARVAQLGGLELQAMIRVVGEHSRITEKELTNFTAKGESIITDFKQSTASKVDQLVKAMEKFTGKADTESGSMMLTKPEGHISNTVPQSQSGVGSAGSHRLRALRAQAKPGKVVLAD